MPKLVEMNQSSPLYHQIPQSLVGDSHWIVALKDDERGVVIEPKTGEALGRELKASQQVDRCVTVELTFCAKSLADATAKPSAEEEGKKEKNSSTSDSIGAKDGDNGEGDDGKKKSSEASESNGATNAEDGDVEGGNENDETNNVTEEDFEDDSYDYTEEEKDCIKAIMRESQELFPPGKIYETAKSLWDLYQQTIGDKYGFRLRKHGCSLTCTRGEMPGYVKKKAEETRAKIPGDQRRNRRTIRCGCLFRINFSPCNRRDKVDKSVKMTVANFRHTNGCKGIEPVLLTTKQEAELERVARGARKLNIKPKDKKSATDLVEHFRPMFRALAKHPQQKAYLHVLEGLRCTIEGKESVESAPAAAAASETNAKTAEDDEAEESVEEMC